MAKRKPNPAQLAAKQTANMRAAYKLLAEKCGIKQGDEVKVIRAFLPDEMGCNIDDDDTQWLETFVGGTYTVADVYDGQFYLDGEVWFPFFCLVQTDDPLRQRLNDEYTASIVRNGSAVVVGCQEIEFEAVEKLYKKMAALLE